MRVVRIISFSFFSGCVWSLIAEFLLVLAYIILARLYIILSVSCTKSRQFVVGINSSLTFQAV